MYSHPQALGQCTLFLNGRLRGIETVDVSSTSRAAEMVYQESTGAAPETPCESAAVSSAVAARALGLDVLARDIEDRADNTTRFFVLRRLDGGGGGGRAATADVETLLCRTRASARKTADGDERKTKSLVSFTVPHRSPGALADVLDAFRRSGLNLTSISSRPRNGPGPDPVPVPKPTTPSTSASSSAPGPADDGNDDGPASFQYVFFVEFEGHRDRDPGGRVRDALAGVAASARAWRWLGSWDDMLAA